MMRPLAKAQPNLQRAAPKMSSALPFPSLSNGKSLKQRKKEVKLSLVKVSIIRGERFFNDIKHIEPCHYDEERSLVVVLLSGERSAFISYSSPILNHNSQDDCITLLCSSLLTLYCIVKKFWFLRTVTDQVYLQVAHIHKYIPEKRDLINTLRETCHFFVDTPGKANVLDKLSAQRAFFWKFVTIALG